MSPPHPCGEDRQSSDTGTGEETQAQTVTKGPVVGAVAVAETEYGLTPSKAAAKRKGLVEFRVVNRGSVVHALEVEGPNGEQKTGSIRPGRSATLRVDLGTTGSYKMYCPIDDHKGKGMRGAVVVGGASGGTAGQSPGTDTSEKGAGTGGKAPEQSSGY